MPCRGADFWLISEFSLSANAHYRGGGCANSAPVTGIPHVLGGHNRAPGGVFRAAARGFDEIHRIVREGRTPLSRKAWLVNYINPFQGKVFGMALQKICPHPLVRPVR